jgi:hypothetical protein
MNDKFKKQLKEAIFNFIFERLDEQGPLGAALKLIGGGAKTLPKIAPRTRPAPAMPRSSGPKMPQPKSKPYSQPKIDVSPTFQEYPKVSPSPESSSDRTTDTKQGPRKPRKPEVDGSPKTVSLQYRKTTTEPSKPSSEDQNTESKNRTKYKGSYFDTKKNKTRYK